MTTGWLFIVIVVLLLWLGSCVEFTGTSFRSDIAWGGGK